MPQVRSLTYVQLTGLSIPIRHEKNAWLEFVLRFLVVQLSFRSLSLFCVVRASRPPISVRAFDNLEFVLVAVATQANIVNVSGSGYIWLRPSAFV